MNAFYTANIIEFLNNVEKVQKKDKERGYLAHVVVEFHEGMLRVAHLQIWFLKKPATFPEDPSLDKPDIDVGFAAVDCPDGNTKYFFTNVEDYDVHEAVGEDELLDELEKL